jgi:hypothetical protein
MHWQVWRTAYCPRRLEWAFPVAVKQQSTRRFIENMPADFVTAKLDFSNAFNRIRRDIMLNTEAKQLPLLYKFCHLTYSQPSKLKFGSHVILSEEGAQQGDPLGTLLFRITLQPLLLELKSSLCIAYIDDVTVGGQPGVVSAGVQHINDAGPSYGLHLNIAKCEVIYRRRISDDSILASFVQLTPDTATLLGAPLSRGPAMDDIISTRCDDLARMISRFQFISLHDALLLLKSSFGVQRLLFTLRSAPCVDHLLLHKFDDLLRTAISNICIL